MVDTTSASLGNAIEGKAIVELPFFARNVANLLQYQPGVVSFGTENNPTLDHRNGAVNGGKSDQSDITLDGVDLNDQNQRRAFTSVLRRRRPVDCLAPTLLPEPDRLPSRTVSTTS
jgi:hypothetical protein